MPSNRCGFKSSPFDARSRRAVALAGKGAGKFMRQFASPTAAHVVPGLRSVPSHRPFDVPQSFEEGPVRRNSDRNPGRALLKRAAPLVLACFAALCCGRVSAQGCVFQTDTGHPYKMQWKFRPQTGSVRGPSLKVVALGDSVVWGDGDKPEHKIVTSVSQNLANDSGRLVELDSYAHSGARLQYAPGEPATFPVRHGLPVGDVDASRPTTEEQAACGKIEDSDADYVLMDGCINEVGATNIALPPTFGLNKRTTAEIRADVLEYCAAPMRNVLEELLDEFPRAKIVLLNYFLVVSQKSEPKPEVSRQTDKREKKQQNELERAVKKEASLDGTAREHSMTKAEIVNRVQAWRDNSVEFLNDTTSCFEWAIASASTGGKDPATPEPDTTKPACKGFQLGTASQPSTGRILLAQVSSNPNFSYGAPESHLWLLPIPLFLGIAINPDEMFRPRNCECDRTHFLARGDSGCKVNPIAHPKPAGAQCYAKSVLNSLGMPWKPPAGESSVNCGEEYRYPQ